MDVPAILSMAANLAVLVGVVVALVELRQALRARRDLAAVEIVRAIQTPEIRRAVERILTLPDDVDPVIVRGDPLLLDAALTIDSACETWGAIVYEGLIEIHMFDRMVGGMVRGTWRRLRRWAEDLRDTNRNPNMAEWWQWLYERLEEDPDPGKAKGAYVSFRGRSRR